MFKSINAAFIILALASILLSNEARANPPRSCQIQTLFTSEDISAGGTFTSDAVTINGAHQVHINFSLTDANDSVTASATTIEHSSNSSFGIAFVLGGCSGSPSATCGVRTLNWDPSTHGKIYTIPWPVAHQAMRIKYTPTGAGAGDTLTSSIVICK